MKRLFLTTLFLLLTFPSLRAECDSTNLTILNLHGGVGYGLYRDLGASPLTYRGLQLHPGISVQWQHSDWRYEAMLLAGGGCYGLKLGIGYIQAYGGNPLLGFRAWHRLARENHLQIWAGGSLDNLVDIRYTPSLGNACAAFGNYARLNLEGCVEYRLGNWQFHVWLQMGALSLNFRPGFAYMDNFDQDISSPSSNTFDQYRTYPTLATSATTDFGATLLLPAGNRIGLSYQWSFLTSRTTRSAPHLFQYAHHALLFCLGFLLN